MKAGKDYFVMFTEDKAKRKYLDRALEYVFSFFLHLWPYFPGSNPQVL
jgi:hypothetical protein